MFREARFHPWWVPLKEPWILNGRFLLTSPLFHILFLPLPFQLLPAALCVAAEEIRPQNYLFSSPSQEKCLSLIWSHLLHHFIPLGWGGGTMGLGRVPPPPEGSPDHGRALMSVCGSAALLKGTWAELRPFSLPTGCLL